MGSLKNLLSLSLGQLQGRGRTRGQGNPVAFLSHWDWLLARSVGILELTEFAQQILPRVKAAWTVTTPARTPPREGVELFLFHSSTLAYIYLIIGYFLALQWVCATLSGLVSWLAPALPGSHSTRPQRETAAGYETDNYETDNCYETDSCYDTDNSRNAGLYWCCSAGFWAHQH